MSALNSNGTPKRSPGKIESDVRMMVRQLDGPYFINRSRLAYRVSEEEFQDLFNAIEALRLIMPSRIGDIYSTEYPSKITILGIQILKR